MEHHGTVSFKLLLILMFPVSSKHAENPLTVTKHECKCGVSCLAPKSRALALVLPRDGRSRGG